MIPLIYTLPTGRLFGAPPDGLCGEFPPAVSAPAGKFLSEARKTGFAAQSFTNPADSTIKLRRLTSARRASGFMAAESPKAAFDRPSAAASGGTGLLTFRFSPENADRRTSPVIYRKKRRGRRI